MAKTTLGAASWLLVMGAMCACASAGPSGPEPGPGVVLALAPGQQQAAYAGFRVELIKVENDSRCPAGVQCVWQGDASVHLGFSTDTLSLSAPVVLHTGVEPKSTVAHGYEVRLDSLKPGTNANTQIPQSEYRAFVTVTKKATASTGPYGF